MPGSLAGFDRSKDRTKARSREVTPASIPFQRPVNIPAPSQLAGGRPEDQPTAQPRAPSVAPPKPKAPTAAKDSREGWSASPEALRESLEQMSFKQLAETTELYFSRSTKLSAENSALKKEKRELLDKITRLEEQAAAAIPAPTEPETMPEPADHSAVSALEQQYSAQFSALKEISAEQSAELTRKSVELQVQTEAATQLERSKLEALAEKDRELAEKDRELAEVRAQWVTFAQGPPSLAWGRLWPLSPTAHACHDQVGQWADRDVPAGDSSHTLPWGRVGRALIESALSLCLSGESRRHFGQTQRDH